MQTPGTVTLSADIAGWQRVDLDKLVGDEVNQVRVVIPAATLAKIDESSEPVELTYRSMTISVPASVLSACKQEKKDVALCLNYPRQSPVVSGQPDEVYSGMGWALDVKLVAMEQTTDRELTLTEPLELVLKVDADKLTSEQIEGLGLYLYDPGSKSWQCIGNDLVGDVIEGLVDHSGQIALMSYNRQFNDLTGHWAAGDIGFMARKRLAVGVSVGEFAPNAAVTRAEFTVLLARILGLKPIDNNHFKDIQGSEWYAGMVNAAKAKGLVSGMDGEFKPNQRITREQMAAMLMNAYRLSGKTVHNAPMTSFKDKSAISVWALISVRDAQALGLVRGRSPGYYAPKEGATRSEAFVTVKRLLDQIH